MVDWKQDPKLKGMDKNKLDLLEDFAERVKRTPQHRLLPSLVSFHMEAQAKGLVFSDQEAEIIVSILAADMPPNERKKIDMLKTFSRQFSEKKTFLTKRVQ